MFEFKGAAALKPGILSIHKNNVIMSLLQFPGCHDYNHLRHSAQMLSFLGHMTDLQELSLRGSPHGGTSTNLRAEIIYSLSSCLSLRSLDLSYMKIRIEGVSVY